MKSLRAEVDFKFPDLKKSKENGNAFDANISPLYVITSMKLCVSLQRKVLRSTLRLLRSDIIKLRSKMETKRRKPTYDTFLLSASAAMRIMIIVIKKIKENAWLYKTVIGQRFSGFRERIILIALNAAQKNSSKTF